MTHTYPVNSGLTGDIPFYGPYQTDSDRKMIAGHEDALAARLEDGTADLNDVCVYFGFCAAKPSVIRAMVKPDHRRDAMAIDADIRRGIHDLAPSLDQDAHYFIAAIVAEYGASYQQAAE